ncbi:MAG: sulfate ABC transporter substrate-binding protein [Thermoguttaceae bacterium]|nr:sulfate ABC transporter substrate-binding protein [Thermoguttaceae bacterium]
MKLRNTASALTTHDSKHANDHQERLLWSRRTWLAGTLASCCGLSGCTSKSSSDTQLVNVSYDPTREFYEAFNTAFAKYYAEKGKPNVSFKMSHGGSGKQSRAVMDGIPADVVSLALPFDIDMIAEKTGLIDSDWQTRFPHNASPYQSTIIFMVRKGNPRNIHSWSDLTRDDVQVITPNPKISGAARYNFLAAWGYVLKQELGDLESLNTPDSPKVLAAEAKALEFLRKMFQNVPVLDSGARSATMTFTRSQIGDVLLNWENEAFLAATESNDHEFEMVVPELSILAEPPVAVVDRVAEQHGTTQLAHDYLEYLYSDVGQTLAAKHYYRPSEPEHVEPSLLDPFQPLERFSVSSVFGSWKAAQTRFFNDGGVFDQIFVPK